MRLGVMGGTFDPVHIGHLVTAEEARCQFGLEEVIFVPSARPPHKTGLRQSPPWQRLRMVEMAVDGNPFLTVSDIEVSRQGLSYTIDTLKSIRVMRGRYAELFFITGADAILEILTWKNPEELLSESSFIAASRPGHRLDSVREALPEFNSAGEKAADRVFEMEIPALAISSTEIRERVSAGRTFRYLVPEQVWEYIRENGLYMKR